MALPTDGFGIYEGIFTNTGPSVWQPRLQQIAQGEFALVLNYGLLHGHIADVTGYINYAASLGMKVIVYLADPAIWRDNTYSTTYAQLYADSGNAATGTAFMQYIVAQTKNLAGVWGWYVGDEPAFGDHATLKTYCDAVKAADSTHPRLLITSGANASNSFTASSTPYYDCCEVGGDDYYPLGTFGNTESIAAMSTVATGTQTYTQAKGIQSAFALQAHSLANYGTYGAPWPTVSQMLQMRTNAINNMSPRVLLWYTYYDVISANAPLLQWYFLSNAAQGKSGIARFPPATRRGSPAQNNSYTQTILADTPVAYYRLSEAVGKVAYDQTSNHYDGTLSNTGVTLSQPGAINYDSNTSMLFNNGWITLPTALNGSGLSAFSVEMWIKANAFPASGAFATFIQSDLASTNHGYALYLSNSSGQIQVAFSVGNGTTSLIAADTPAAPYALNTWYQVVGAFDGSFVYCFVNGVLRAKVALSGTIGTTVVAPVVGASSNNHTVTFSGFIDEISLYTSFLGNKVPAHYAAALRAPSTLALFPPATRRQS